MKHLLHAVIFLLALSFASSGSADQRDPQLEELFKMLHATKISHEGQQITNLIWDIWRKSDNKTVDRYMRKGITAMEYGKYKSAFDAFSQVIEIAPDYAEGWNKRATLLYIVGDYERSAADVKETLVLEPRHFGALSGLGMIYERTNRYKAAIKAFQEALKVNPHLVQARHNIDIIRKQLLGDAI